MGITTKEIEFLKLGQQTGVLTQREYLMVFAGLTDYKSKIQRLLSLGIIEMKDFGIYRLTQRGEDVVKNG